MYLKDTEPLYHAFMYSLIRCYLRKVAQRYVAVAGGELFTSTPALGLASRLRQVAQCFCCCGPSLSCCTWAVFGVQSCTHLQVVVVLAVWGIFNNTNGSIFTS